MRPIIIYTRVSTDRQGKSGLGLEAQRSACRQFATQHDYEIVSEYSEVETGKGSDALERRPRLAAALSEARKRKCAVLVAKLDRLSRDVHFISGLVANHVQFVVAELGPEVEPFMLHLYAALAEKERHMISQRTRAALEAKRSQGARLGNRTNLADAQAKGRRERTKRASQFAENVLPIIREVQAAGVATYTGIAAALNARGISTVRGGDWHPSTVRKVMMRGSVPVI